MNLDEYLSSYDAKNSGGKQKFGYAKNVYFGQEIRTLSPVAYIILWQLIRTGFPAI